jgi:hypothetical protein
LEALAMAAAIAALGPAGCLGGRIGIWRVGFIRLALFGRRLRRLGLIEEQIKTVAECLLLVLGFGERQQEGIAQDAAVGEADLGDRAHRIDAFGRREPDACAPRRTKEAMQVLSHRAPIRRRSDVRPWR